MTAIITGRLEKGNKHFSAVAKKNESTPKARRVEGKFIFARPLTLTGVNQRVKGRKMRRHPL